MLRVQQAHKIEIRFRDFLWQIPESGLKGSMQETATNVAESLVH